MHRFRGQQGEFFWKTGSISKRKEGKTLLGKAINIIENVCLEKKIDWLTYILLLEHFITGINAEDIFQISGQSQFLVSQHQKGHQANLSSLSIRKYPMIIQTIYHLENLETILPQIDRQIDRYQQQPNQFYHNLQNQSIKVFKSNAILPTFLSFHPQQQPTTQLEQNPYPPSILISMEQIKFLRQSNTKSPDDQRYEFQEIVGNTRRKKRQPIQSLQPWFEDADSNPFLAFKSERIKKAQSPRIKRQGSLSLTKVWKAQEKSIKHRESKVLPIMDVGELNKIKKSIYPNKSKSKLELSSPSKLISRSSSTSQSTLPSVTRQLHIQRKIFLMKHISNQDNTISPQKSSRIRNIISQLRN